MKIFRVVTEYDGETTKGDGERSTEIINREYRYAAETIQRVFAELKNMTDDETLIAVIEEHPAVFILSE